MRGVVWDGERLLYTDELEVRPPGPGEVQVRVRASGICHSDLNVVDGTSPLPPPVVLGHEAAGVVETVGPGVQRARTGDAVVVGSMRPCGRCRFCARGRPADCPDAFGGGEPPFRWRGRATRAFANVSSFAELITVHENQLVHARGIDPCAAALIGCAVSTGYGVVRNVADVGRGDTVVVFGVGGIGVNAIQTARLQHAAKIVAVDVDSARGPIARRFGATAFVAVPRDAGAATVAALVAGAAGTPIDVAIECSGAPVAIEAACRVLGPAGTAALVGIPPPRFSTPLEIGPLLRQRRRVIGSLNGAVVPSRDLSDIVEHARAGRLELEAQVTRVWPIAQFDEAVASLRRGEVVRAVLAHPADG
jgi:S-(hydroxymethyl)glutathione dehydrogenase/alcohol dehydrogenase